MTWLTVALIIVVLWLGAALLEQRRLTRRYRRESAFWHSMYETTYRDLRMHDTEALAHHRAQHDAPNVVRLRDRRGR